MKRVILFLLLALGSPALYAQDVIEDRKSGDVLKGEGVAYRLYKDDFFWVLYNDKNKIATHEENPKDWARVPFSPPRPGNILADGMPWAPESMKKKVGKIFHRLLTPKELKLLKENDRYAILGVHCYMTPEGRVQEVSFHISSNPEEKASVFWRNFPVDRFHRLERKIIRKIDEGKQEWLKKECEKRREWSQEKKKNVEKMYVNISICLSCK